MAKIPFSKQLTNCSIDYKESTCDYDVPLNIIVTANEDCVLKEVYIRYYYEDVFDSASEDHKYSIGDKPKTFNVVYNFDDLPDKSAYTEIELVATAEENLPTFNGVKFKQILNNVTSDFPGSSSGNVFDFNLIANDGYLLSNVKLTIDYEENPFAVESDVITFNPNNAKTYHFTYDISNRPQNNETPNFYTLEVDTIVDESSETPNQPNTTPTTHIYEVDEDDLNVIQNKRFNTMEGDKIDLATFILGMFKVPFVVDSKYKTERTTVTLGKTVIEGLTVSELSIQDYQIVLGSFTIPRTTNTDVDFQNVRIFLQFPFFDEIEMDSSVIGKEITVALNVHLINGDSTLTLKHSDNLILSRDFNMFQDIPFIHFENNSIIDTINTLKNVANTKTFVRIVRNVEIENQIYSIDKAIDLSGFTGYVSGDFQQINGINSSSELDLINTVFRNGVIINEH